MVARRVIQAAGRFKPMKIRQEKRVRFVNAL